MFTTQILGPNVREKEVQIINITKISRNLVRVFMLLPLLTTINVFPVWSDKISVKVNG